MLSAIIATHESERPLVRTLAALVPGSTAGLLSEVIVADAGSCDATAEVADTAGCHFIVSPGPLGARLKAAAMTARAPWLLFLRAGAIPEPGWVEIVERFTAKLDHSQAAAIFRPAAADLVHPGLTEIVALVRAAVGGWARPEQGLLITRRLYDSLGGHSNSDDAESALLRRIGRRRIVILGARLFSARQDT